MKAAAANLDFEQAAALRDQIRDAARRASWGSATGRRPRELTRAGAG